MKNTKEKIDGNQYVIFLVSEIMVLNATCNQTCKPV